MQERTKTGVGLINKQAEPIIKQQKEYLWENKVLVDESPETIFRTMFWVVGVYFGLRGGVEHRKLTLGNFEVSSDSDGRRFLTIYRDSVEV